MMRVHCANLLLDSFTSQAVQHSIHVLRCCTACCSTTVCLELAVFLVIYSESSSAIPGFAIYRYLYSHKSNPVKVFLAKYFFYKTGQQNGISSRD